jgi:hypothetical protein
MNKKMFLPIFAILAMQHFSLFCGSQAESHTDNATKKPTYKGKESQQPRSLSYYYDQDTEEVFTYADWIYWRPVTEEPMNWLDKTFSMNNTSGNLQQASTKRKSLVYDFSSGFRVGAGYRFAKDMFDDDIRPWQIEAEYTRLHTAEAGHAKAVGVLSTQTQEILSADVPVLTPPQQVGMPAVFINGHGRVHLEYDRLDLKFSWPIWIQSNLILRLKTGATFAWFENNWISRFRANLFNSTGGVVAPGHTETTKLKWHWWGGGLFGGGDICLPIGKGIGFFVDSSFGLLFGPMKQKEEYSIINGPTSEPNAQENKKYHFQTFQPVVNFGAGIDYKYWFRDIVMMHLALGWEFTWWFDMDQFGRVNQRSSAIAPTNSYFNTSPKDLGFEGLTARLGFDF